MKAYKAEYELLERKFGLPEAKASEEAAMDDVIAVRDEFDAIPATTLAGLKFKAQMALPYAVSESQGAEVCGLRRGARHLDRERPACDGLKPARRLARFPGA